MSGPPTCFKFLCLKFFPVPPNEELNNLLIYFTLSYNKGLRSYSYLKYGLSFLTEKRQSHIAQNKDGGFQDLSGETDVLMAETLTRVAV